MPTPSALVLDEPGAHRDALVTLIDRAGFTVSTADDADAATQRLAQGAVDVAFLRIGRRCPDTSALIRHRGLADAAEVVVMADRDDRRLVDRAIRAGATYYFCKPLDAPFLEALLDDVRSELADRRPAAAAEPIPEIPALDQFGLLRGSSPAMRRLHRILRKVAPTDTTVLLFGESGTGKELAAETIHRFSPRSDEPFEALNCGAVPSGLIESELFGHERGSFSGAERRHEGVFERAGRGTLLLDEITEMPLPQQVRLLRVLETGRFRRVGGETDHPVRARVLAASNRDPDQAIADGSLREDLYYRLAGFPLHLPPLRERGSDVIGLAQLFLNELNETQERTVRFSAEALEALREHTWPGNVRELRAAVEQSWILADDVIRDVEVTAQAAGDAPTEGEVRVPLGTPVRAMERELIEGTLAAWGGDKPRTAQALGISLKTLYNRLNAYAAEDATDSRDGAGNRED